MYNTATPHHKGQNKDKHKRQKQLTIVRAAFYSPPASMLMIARKAVIERANICRIVSNLRKAGAITHFRKGFCSKGSRAGFYTTNLEGGRNNG